MAKKRKSYDIRPKSSRVRKPWTDLSSSGKNYWRRKLDVRPRNERRTNPLDRIKTATERARYIKPVFRTPYQQRIVVQTGDYRPPLRTVGRRPPPPPPKRLPPAPPKSEKTSYGYDIDDFLSRSSHPEGYTYILFHIFWNPRYKGHGSLVTIRGTQYNTVEDVRAGYQDEIDEVIEESFDSEAPIEYVQTIVQVVPKRGSERVPGSVYPEDYHPKERPGTREYEIEQGKTFLREKGPFRDRGGKPNG